MSPIVKAMQFLFELRRKGQNVDNVIDRLDECMTESEYAEYLDARMKNLISLDTM